MARGGAKLRLKPTLVCKTWGEHVDASCLEYCSRRTAPQNPQPDFGSCTLGVLPLDKLGDHAKTPARASRKAPFLTEAQVGKGEVAAKNPMPSPK